MALVALLYRLYMLWVKHLRGNAPRAGHSEIKMVTVQRIIPARKGSTSLSMHAGLRKSKSRTDPRYRILNN